MQLKIKTFHHLYPFKWCCSSIYNESMKTLIRIVVFQSLWFAFLSLHDFEWNFILPIIALFCVYLDWKIFQSGISFQKLNVFILFLLVCGLLIDTPLHYLGFVEFEQLSFGLFSPFFMWCMWIIFVPYYDFAFSKFFNAKKLAVLLVLFFAPLAYKGGSRIADFEFSTASLVYIALMWGVFFPVSLLVYQKLVKKSEV